MSDIPLSTLKAAVRWLYCDCHDILERAIDTAPTNPHDSGGMPNHIASALRCISDARNAPEAIPQDDVLRQLSDFLKRQHQKPNAQKLARTIIETMNRECELGLDTSLLPAPAEKQAHRLIFEKIELLDNISSTARTLHAINEEKYPSSLSPQEAEELALEAGKQIIARIADAQAGTVYAMSAEEKEILKKEISEFVSAHTDDYRTSNSPYKEIAKYISYNIDALRSSFSRMSGCGGSDNYQHAVNMFFSRLLDAVIAEQKTRVPEGNTARAR